MNRVVENLVMRFAAVKTADVSAAILAICLIALTRVATTASLDAGYTTEAAASAIDAQAMNQKDVRAQEVLGTVTVAFYPTVLASLPKPPIELTLRIKSDAGDSEFAFSVPTSSAMWVVTDGGATTHQNFSFLLHPGTYTISSIQVEAQSLSNAPFELPTMIPRFTVPEDNCLYVGRILLANVRLPPGSLDQTRAAVGALAKQRDRGFVFIYLTKGSLIPASFAIDMPGDAETDGSANVLAEAREKGCVVELARYPR